MNLISLKDHLKNKLTEKPTIYDTSSDHRLNYPIVKTVNRVINYDKVFNLS